MSDDRSDLDAERQYLQQRERELKQERERAIAELNATFGTALSADSVTPEIATVLAEGVTEGLRRLGNVPLSQEYEAAWSDWTRLNERVQRLRAQSTLTAEDHAQLDAACDVAGEAFEHYERVEAKALAWLHSQQERNE